MQYAIIEGVDCLQQITTLVFITLRLFSAYLLFQFKETSCVVYLRHNRVSLDLTVPPYATMYPRQPKTLTPSCLPHACAVMAGLTKGMRIMFVFTCSQPQFTTTKLYYYQNLFTEPTGSISHHKFLHRLKLLLITSMFLYENAQNKHHDQILILGGILLSQSQRNMTINKKYCIQSTYDPIITECF